ncbi:hypothetical protein [Streptomyces albipurpureus]|uniref:Amino acid ABC transporter permease n=1 Tax=Streptomyces albipurpureus TaxID=2897419 RepID=A0ABT0UXZ7_9ACTN|nr:hypothetical protein [Streptomyces sp. CWNU-1]MCM2393126.1 hypothetical protein [Streptomyces sp. CWNU-1]
MTGAGADPWQELFELAERPRDARTGTGMSLASVAGSPGGPGAPGAKGATGVLKHEAQPWTSAAAAAGAIRTNTASANAKLTSAHEGVDSGAAGLASLGVLRTVLTSWERRLGAVRDECGYLDPVLKRVATDQGENEKTVKSSFRQAAPSAAEKSG